MLALPEVWHPDLTPDEIPRALKIAYEYDLYISDGSDHLGLCGGQYCFFDDYKSCEYYIPELSAGTPRKMFSELLAGHLMQGRRELIGEYIEYYRSLGV